MSHSLSQEFEENDAAPCSPDTQWFLELPDSDLIDPQVQSFLENEKLEIDDMELEFLEYEDPIIQTGGGFINKPSTSNQSDLVSFDLKENRKRNIKKYNGEETDYEVIFNLNSSSNISILDIEEGVLQLFNRIIQRSTIMLNPGDLIRICVDNPSLDSPLSTRMMPVSEMTAEKIVSQIEKVVISGKKINLDSSLKINVLTVRLALGSGRTKIINLPLDTKSKKSIITIDNQDELCCARAIVVAVAHLENNPRKKYISAGNKPLQGVLARELHYKANVTLGPCGHSEIEKFASHLSIQINVVDAQAFNKVTYKTPEKSKKIFLWLKNNHYDVITKMTGFLGTSYYCVHCDVGYKTKSSHRCQNRCPTCFLDTCFATRPVNCPDCNKMCRSLECFERHKNSKSKNLSLCAQFGLCGDCYKIYKKKFPHICGQSICKFCKQTCTTSDHLCFMRRAEICPPTEKYIFFDFEVDQSSGEHLVNFILMQYMNGSEKQFDGYDCLERFGAFLFSPAHKGYTVIAHNMQGYDGILLMSYLIKQTIKPNVIMKGSKVLCLTLPSLKIRIIDSLSFLPMPLSRLPTTFGLEDIKKGFFPHLFNTRSNQQYEGPFPEAENFCPDTMSNKERVQFFEWYNCHKKESFNFRKELTEYCRSDVDILRRCCVTFRENFIKMTGMDPFHQITIAAACMRVYSTLFLQPRTIAIFPQNGYVKNINTSQLALEWLGFMEFKSGRTIQHSRRGAGEVKVLSRYVDGFHEATKTVYEFYGCYYHGCSKCFQPSTIHPSINKPMWKLENEAKERRDALKRAGYIVTYVWEHDFVENKKKNKELREWLLEFKCIPRLNPRSAFYGGRTGVSKLYHHAKAPEKIKYIDFTSLYPYVNKYCAYPIGHPVIITNDFKSIENYFGLILCTILPPKNLFHPVLPTRSRGKLIFGLCQTCIETRKNPPCNHTQSERSLTGTWTTIEVKKAIDMNYTLLEIHEVYHFEERSENLFKPYIDLFLKIKQEASGWPIGCESEEERKNYIDSYFQREGILLDVNNIKKNPGLRALSKLMLNSFWGKFGQNEDKLQTIFVSSLQEFNKYFSNEEFEVHNVAFPTPEIAMIQFKVKRNFIESNPRGNVFIAAFTTAYARLKLLDALLKLDKDVLYYDTDSIIYISKETNDPEIGNYLGDFTDELGGSHIKEFVAAGPKNYGYETATGETACKIRGFTLNYQNSIKLNFECLKNVIVNNNREPIVTKNVKFRINKKEFKIENKEETKQYIFSFDKRAVIHDF